MSGIVPKKLAFYYGYLSALNGLSTASEVVSELNNYDMVVLGNGLASSTHPDYSFTQSVLTDMALTAEIFGYIDSTLSLNEIQEQIDDWYALDVEGIFMDKFGYDFANSREHQREIVWCIHEKGSGLKAFVNAWNPDDAFSDAVEVTYNPNGLATRLGSNDWYLAESYHIINGAYDTNITAFKDKNNKMLNYKSTYSTKMAMTTTNDSSAFDQDKWDNAYYLAVAYGLDSASWGEEFFSASSASLPFRTRKEVLGTYFTGSLVENSGVFEIQTNIGIHVDTNSHNATELLD